MKAIYIETHGGPEVLTYGEMPEPEIEPHEVKIRVRACSVNRLDTYTRAGIRGTRNRVSHPLVLGGDASGDVVEVGLNTRKVSVGDRVLVNPRISCGICSYCASGNDDLCLDSKFMGTDVNGSYCEFIKAPESNIYLIAPHVSYEEAASVPTVYLPTWNILVRRAKLKPWETVLVLSASAGVGTAAIQVARNVIGARVIATTSSQDKIAKAQEIGASHVIDYSQEDVAQRVHELTDGVGVDVVVDHVGSEFFTSAYNALANGGRYGVCGVTSGYRSELNMGALFTKHLQIFGVFMGCKEDMRQIVEMLDKGRIRPKIHRTFPLEWAADAHVTMEERKFFGKLVLRP